MKIDLHVELTVVIANAGYYTNIKVAVSLLTV